MVSIAAGCFTWIMDNFIDEDYINQWLDDDPEMQADLLRPAA